MQSVNTQANRVLQMQCFWGGTIGEVLLQVNSWLRKGHNVEYRGPVRLNGSVWAVTIYYWKDLEDALDCS